MQNFVRVCSATAAVATTGFAIYSAQPWGDNYAYQNFTGYLGLILFIAWSISPYAFMYGAAAWLPEHPRLMAFRAVVTSVLCISAVAIIFDAVFIHIDAQGGLVFLFIPFYQWVILGLLELASRIISRYALKQRR